MTRAIILAVLLAASGSACANKEESGSKGGAPATEPLDVEPVFAGRVLQRIRTGSYAYLEVRTASGADRWVVTLGSGAPRGSEIEVRAFGVRHEFRSKRLGRTFEHLVFGIVHEKS